MCTDVFISSLYAFQKVGVLGESSALLCPNSSPALLRSTWTDSDPQTSALIKSLLLLLEEGLMQTETLFWKGRLTGRAAKNAIYYEVMEKL